MEIASNLITVLSSQQFIVPTIVTGLCLFFALFAAVRSILKTPKSDEKNGGDFATSEGKKEEKDCNCVCSCNGNVGGGGVTEMVEKVNSAAVVAAERQTGASMMEQLVPEITTHALSYLDYPSLCRLSMTNSLMRKAANDDNAWKALYHKVICSLCNCKCNCYIALLGIWKVVILLNYDTAWKIGNCNCKEYCIV